MSYIGISPYLLLDYQGQVSLAKSIVSSNKKELQTLQLSLSHPSSGHSLLPGGAR